MSARVTGVLVALAMATTLGTAHACPCQGAAGPGAALTNPAQLYGLSTTTTGRWVHGVWSPDGGYAPLGPQSRQWMVDLSLAAALRPIANLEVGVESAVGYQSVMAPGIDSERGGFGDTLTRVRWEAIDEPMPFVKERPLLSPALALIGSVRAPTGYVGAHTSEAQSGTTGSIGSSASAQGLGAWEGSLAAEVARTFERKLRVGLVGEAAYRLPDEALGLERHLGPRLLGQLNLRYRPTVSWGFGVITDIGWEDLVEYEGIRRAGTAQRLFGMAGYWYMLFPDAGLRIGAMLRHAPAIEGISVNAVGATSLAFSVGYAR
jgi:hypothetical protein